MNAFDAIPSSSGSPGWLRQAIRQAPWLAAWLLVLAMLPATPAARQSLGAAERLAEAMAAYRAHDYDVAERLFAEAAALAVADRDRRSEAEALRGLGITLIERARYDDADVALQRAYALFALEGDRAGIGKVFRHRATVADLMGRKADALLFARLALAEFERLDDAGERARAAQRLLSLVDDPGEYDQLYVTALDHAKAASDPSLEADLLHQRADRLFVQGRFAEADTELRRARDLYEGAGDERNVARVLTSLGRLHRAHGAPELALDDFTRAFEIQTRVGDRQGALQSLNAIAVALGHLERHDEALTAYQQALELARQTGSARIVNFQTGNLGGGYLVRGETALAIPLLEVSASQETNSYTRAIRYSQLAEARFRQRAFAASVAAASEAIDAMRAGSMDERLFGVLHRRALAHQALGEAEAALADAREALATIERVRAQLVPDDFLKRGFHNENQDVYTTVIGLLDGAAEHEQAFEVSEQARSRAFLDLLASRGLAPPPAAGDGSSPTGGSPSAIEPGTANGDAPMPPTLRGAAGGQGSRLSTPSVLPSPKAASPLPLEGLLAEGARLRSTVISYWVDREHTIVWVAAPDQPLKSVRVDVTRGRLTRLVRALWAGIDSSLPAPPVPIAAPSTRRARPADREPDGPSYIAPRRAARELYELLIGPIESALPRAEGSRLTIVPHGPLFRLSFAALLDRRNRYFLERHTLHYAPALSMLQMTGRLRAERQSGPAAYLLVGNPASMPLSAGQPLPPLPGAAREVTAIARQLPSSVVTVLTGAEATEQAVRDAAPGKRIVHFATHGVVDDDDPLGSFLALGTVEGDGAGAGRLTAEEIYRLPLDADLVVLSACRTGLGELSADGIVGLTRAFFSAGTPSLVATLWDVVDGPPATLLPDFYRSMHRHDKAAALRAAQLRLLRDLRAGRVMVDTPGGPVALPERPVFWASFVLMGEP